MRQFLALEIPETMRRHLAELQVRLRGELGGWRWVASANIHLTIRFLGQAEEVLDWSPVARQASPCLLRLGGLGQFPPRGRPRVLHVPVEDRSGSGALARLVRLTEEAARQAGFEAEERAFRPHLTLARAARGARPVPPRGGVGPEPLEAHITDLTLFRSQLGPAGARYTVLARYPLGAGSESDDGEHHD